MSWLSPGTVRSVEYLVRQEYLAALTSVIRRLSTHLADITEARCACAAGLTCGVYAWEEEQISGRSSKLLRKKYAGLVDALCVVFFTPVTEPQFTELCAVLTQCEGSCDMSDADISFLHQGPGYDKNPHISQDQVEAEFHDFVACCFQLFGRLVVDLRPGALEKVLQDGGDHVDAQHPQRTTIVLLLLVVPCSRRWLSFLFPALTPRSKHAISGFSLPDAPPSCSLLFSACIALLPDSIPPSSLNQALLLSLSQKSGALRKSRPVDTLTNAFARRCQLFERASPTVFPPRGARGGGTVRVFGREWCLIVSSTPLPHRSA